MSRSIFESASSYITYYVPFIRSYEVVTTGFSPQEISEIREIISNASSLENLEKNRSVKITFDKDLLISGINRGGYNLTPSINDIEISTKNENDPVTEEIVDAILPKIKSKIKVSKNVSPDKKTASSLPTNTIPVNVENISVSSNGLNLIKKFEGFRDTPYICPGGMLTIGYGNVIKEGEYTKITRDQAEALLRSTVSSFEKTIQKNVKAPLTQNQYDALVSFAYNVGSGAFSKSTLLKLINNKDYRGAAEEFSKWTKSNGKVLRGLQRRRDEEKALFLS